MSDTSTMRVFMRPAWLTDNSFTHSLADALVDEGMEVVELRYGWNALYSKPGVVFLHWPNEFFFIRDVEPAARAMATLVRLSWLKHRYGQKLVWLVHNLEPHDGKGRSFPVARNLFFKMLDGVVFLSATSRSLFEDRYPGSAAVPSLVTKHGHYVQAAIRKASMPSPASDRPVRAKCVGRIKRYKAPELLAVAAAAIPDLVELTISGEIHEPELGEELKAAVCDAPNVSLDIRHLSAADFEAEVDAADVIVMAYRDILNSGSALYALSRNRPFVGPRLGSLVELQADVGERWVWLYDGELTSGKLAEAARWVAETDRSVPPDLSLYDWQEIGRNLRSFLSNL